MKQKRKRHGRGHAKGANFERDFCRELSDWWSYGRDEDIFWRTQGSGARSTSRRRKGGQAIPGQVLDIGAMHPSGLEFLKKIVISLKRGKHMGITIQDLIDLPEDISPTHNMRRWIIECQEAAASVNTYWMLVFKRDRKDTIVVLPSVLCFSLLPEGRNFSRLEIRALKTWVGIMTLKDFFAINPSQVKLL